MSAALPPTLADEGRDDGQSDTLASVRLTRSRERMRQFLGRDAPRRSGASPASGFGPEAPAVAPGWVQALGNHPLVNGVLSAARDWWVHHPVYGVVRVVGLSASQSVGPVARRHPLALVGAAFVVGAASVRLRPWRWLLRPALIASVAVQIASRFAATMPGDSLLAAVNALLRPEAAPTPRPQSSRTST